MGKLTTSILQVVIALALVGSLAVQTFIVPAIWVDLEGAPPAARITFVVLIVLGVVTMQVFAVCVWQLLTKVRKGSVFSNSSFRYVDTIVWSISAAAVITFALYGLLPMGILVYILGTPSRKRKIKAREAAEQAAYDAEQAAALMADAGAETATSAAPDAGGKTPAAAEGNAVAAVRKEP